MHIQNYIKGNGTKCQNVLILNFLIFLQILYSASVNEIFVFINSNEYLYHNKI